RTSTVFTDLVIAAGVGLFLKVNVGNLVVTESATINEAVILRLAAELAEFIEVRAENILAGTIDVALDMSVTGSLTVGDLALGGRTVVKGGTTGGLVFETPGPDGGEPVPGATWGRDVAVYNSAGEPTASITGEDGAVTGLSGKFAQLSVGG